MEKKLDDIWPELVIELYSEVVELKKRQKKLEDFVYGSNTVRGNTVNPSMPPQRPLDGTAQEHTDVPNPLPSALGSPCVSPTPSQRTHLPTENLGRTPGDQSEGASYMPQYQSTLRNPQMSGDNSNPPSQLQEQEEEARVERQHVFQERESPVMSVEMPRSKLPTYKGTSRWRSFIKLFETMADLYHWEGEVRRRTLIECFRGAQEEL